MKKYRVRWSIGDFTWKSPLLESRAAAEAWAFVHLPIGVLRYRTGTYDILRLR